MTRFSVRRRRLLQAGGAGLFGAFGLGGVAATGADDLVWQFEAGGPVRASPTVVDGTLYVGDDGPSENGTVYALDSATGEQSWTVGVDGLATLSPTAVNGLVIAGSRTEVHALTADGERVWRRARPVEFSPTLADGRAVIGTRVDSALGRRTATASVQAFRAGSGRQDWRFEPDDPSPWFSTPVAVGETVYVGGGAGRLYALDSATGDRRWQAELDGPAVTPPTVSDDVVYAGTAENQLYALDSATGDRLWQAAPGGELLATPTVANDTVFVADREGQLHALTVDGDRRWTADTGGVTTLTFGAVQSSSPTVADGVVFVGGASGPSDEGGGVVALDAATGEELWTAETGVSVLSSPTVVDGTLYVGSQDGRVSAFETPIEGSSAGSRVLLGTLGHHGAWADQAPTTRLDLQPRDPVVGEPVTLDATLTSGDIGRYEWDLTGDGSVDATGPTVSHTFQRVGRHEVTVTVTTTGGETRTAVGTVRVHPSLAWRVETGGPVRASPTVVDGTVYTGDEAELYALDSNTGDVAWTREVGPVLNAPTVVDGTLYVQTPDAPDEGQVHALDAATGAERWTAGFNPAASTAPTVADGSLYVGTSTGPGLARETDGAVHALTLGGGGRRWRFDTAHGVIAAPVVVDETLYVGSSAPGEGRLYAVDTVSGTERWSAAMDGSIASSPTAADGTVYVATGVAGLTPGFTVPDDGELGAFSVATGETLWRAAIEGMVRSSPTVADGAVYVGTMVGDGSGRLSAFDTATGERLWQTRFEDGIRSSPTVAGGRVYVGGDDGGIHALDGATGERLWRLETDDAVVAGPTVVDGTLYVGSQDGRMFAAELPGEASSEGTRVQLGTLGHHEGWADQAPAATFELDPPGPAVDTAVTLDATATSGDIGRYEWDLTGDGSVDATGPTVSHTFQRVGRHEVTVTATDADGGLSTMVRTLSVAPETRWQFEAGGPVRASPTVVDGTLFIGGEQGLFALDADTGDTRWRVDTGVPVDGAPTVVDGTVFVGVDTQSGDPGVSALAADTGEAYWTTPLDGPVRASPTVVDGTLYVGTDAGTLSALVPASGGELWRVRLAGQVRSSPTAVGGTVYVGSSARSVHALDRVDGSTVWSERTDGAVDSSPTVADGVVYAGSDDGTVRAFDAATGEALWRVATDGAVRSSPTVAGGRVYVGSGDGTVRALDAESGDESWAVETGDTVDASPTVAGGRVYVGSDDGRLYAFDAATGETRWRADTGGPVLSSPTVVDGTLYVGSRGGDVYALAAEGSSEGSRVQLGTLGHHGDWRHADQSVDTVTDSGDGDAGGDAGDDADDDGFGPGLGPGAALAGLGGAGYLVHRLQDGADNDEPTG